MSPNTAAIIQNFLESKAVFDAQSPTGFSKWNADTLRMEPYKHTVMVGTEINASIPDLSEDNLGTLLAKYDRVTIAMADGNWKPDIPLPPSSAVNRNRTITVNHDASYASALRVDGENVKVTKGFRKSYLSDGKRWQEVATADQGVPRKPQLFGVPVVTLVGYYDPDEKLQSYIYPAMHGAAGFCYPDDSSTLNEADCHLLVETRDGVLRFRIARHRVNDGYMNKFHINVPEASQPRRIAVVIRGRVLDEQTIDGVNEELVMTVNGIPASRRATK